MRRKYCSIFVSTSVFNWNLSEAVPLTSLGIRFIVRPSYCCTTKGHSFALSLELPVYIKWRYDRYLIKFYMQKFGLIRDRMQEQPATGILHRKFCMEVPEWRMKERHEMTAWLVCLKLIFCCVYSVTWYSRTRGYCAGILREKKIDTWWTWNQPFSFTEQNSSEETNSCLTL